MTWVLPSKKRYTVFGRVSRTLARLRQKIADDLAQEMGTLQSLLDIASTVAQLLDGHSMGMVRRPPWSKIIYCREQLVRRHQCQEAIGYRTARPDSVLGAEFGVLYQETQDRSHFAFVAPRVMNNQDYSSIEVKLTALALPLQMPNLWRKVSQLDYQSLKLRGHLINARQCPADWLRGRA